MLILLRMATLVAVVAFGFVPSAVRADFTFDVIVPEQYLVRTGDSNGHSRGFGWLVVTSGTLPNSDLQASTFRFQIDDPTVISDFRFNPLLNVPLLGDMSEGDVAGVANLAYDLEPGESLVNGNSFWGISFGWPGPIAGSANLDASWTIGNQSVNFNVPFEFNTQNGDVVTAIGQQRFFSQAVPEPSSLLLGSLASLIVASRRRVRR